MHEDRIERGDRQRHHLWRHHLCIHRSSEGRAKITGQFWHVEENSIHTCCGGTPAGHKAPRSRLLTLCPQWDGAEGGKNKSEKSRGLT